MLDPRKIGIIGSTQDQIPIRTIVDDIVVLKNNNAIMILWVGAINFDLLSEEEQDAIIYTYSGLLNSLSFPIQIYIRSQKKDLSLYLNFLNEKTSQTNKKMIKSELKEYYQFVQKLVKDRNVLDKKFYLVIPYINPAVVPEMNFNIFDLFKGQKINQTKVSHIDTNQIITKAKSDLEPKRDHIVRQLARIGLPARQLKDQELISLFHSIYNPNQPLKTASPLDYQSTIVSVASDKLGSEK